MEKTRNLISRFPGNNLGPRFRFLVIALALLLVSGCDYYKPPQEFSELFLNSSLDGSQIRNRLFVPDAAGPKPLLVFLHAWIANYKEDNTRWLKLAKKENWIFLQPDFRGRNDDPNAGGSKLARQDILDAIDYVTDNWNVDPSKVYLAGVSGGGHMSLLMAGYYPERFDAVSAWCPITDLAAWHAECLESPEKQKYAKSIEAIVGGLPSDHAQEIVARSPIHHLSNTKRLPIQIAHGKSD